MKKTAVLSLAVLLVAGGTGVSFAASNPFADVPADHWAYDAIAQLASDGVIDGYGDNTFRGERQITRYEMAQMVARAMTKNATREDKGMAKNTARADKAMLDRLAAEFSDELNNLGVRVAELERNADMVKWTGEMRYIYKSDHREKQKKNDLNRTELRLFPTAEINDRWKIKSRLTARTNMKDDSSGDLKLTYVYAEGAYSSFKVALGKLPLYSTNDDGLVADDFFSGAQLSFGNKLQAVLEAGRWNMTNGNGVGSAFVRDTAANYQGIQLNYNNNKFFGGLGYRHFTSDGFRDVTDYNRSGNEDSANIFSAGASYRFDRNVGLSGAYAKNTKADKYDSGYSMKLSYKGAKKSSAGTWGAHAAYRYVSKNVSMAPTYESMFSQNHRKGWEVGLQYVPFKNIMTDVIYFEGKELNTDRDSKTIYGRARWYF